LVANIHTIILLSANISALSAFYVRAIGLPNPTPFGDDHLGIRLEGGLYLGFDQVEAAAPTGTISLWFDVDNLRARFTRCLELGATSEYEPRRMPWGDEIASLRDPDGNRFGLRQADRTQLPQG
jgi:uncharacterized glyoxalase superfamily protein PhnB